MSGTDPGSSHVHPVEIMSKVGGWGGVSQRLITKHLGVRVNVLQVNCNPSTECCQSTLIVWAAPKSQTKLLFPVQRNDD